eukprot:867913-Prymnesium_polylepis.3
MPTSSCERARQIVFSVCTITRTYAPAHAVRGSLALFLSLVSRRNTTQIRCVAGVRTSVCVAAARA